MAADLTPPPADVVIQLASLVVHADEATAPGSHEFDAIAIRSIVDNPSVKAWLETVPDVLLPQKR